MQITENIHERKKECCSSNPGQNELWTRTHPPHKKGSQRFKEEAFNLVTIDDGLRLVSSSEDDDDADDDEVQSLPGVTLSHSLSHTHTQTQISSD
jgi:hypothetical protein